MKRVAIWRHGLPLNSGAESNVGGGQISDAVVRHLASRCELVAVGPVNKKAHEWLKSLGVTIQPTEDLASFDAIVILTGPSNPLYDGFSFTYRALATARVVPLYLQWDVALPLALDPKNGCPPIRALRVATQLHSLVARKAGRSNGYVSSSVGFVPCFFELLELGREPIEVRVPEHHRFAYFGSDRPGRMKEFSRFFGGRDAPLVDVYGRWSKKSIESLGPNARYVGLVPENEVRSKLNAYASAIYIADAAYVKSDFVAQRFFEQSWSGVPVAFSDRLQPSVWRLLQESLCGAWAHSSSGSLQRWLDRVNGLSLEQRRELVSEQQRVVAKIASIRGMTNVETMLESEVLR